MHVNWISGMMQKRVAVVKMCLMWEIGQATQFEWHITKVYTNNRLHALLIIADGKKAIFSFNI